MHESAWLIALIVLVALAFDFTNGFHDTANAIATSVSTRALPPRIAVVMAAGLNFVGALTFTGVAKTIGGKIADPLHLANGMQVVLAAVIAAIIWNLFTWAKGIPSSSSHALIGALAGAVIASAGWRAIDAAGFLGIIKALVISPILAFAVGWTLMIVMLWLFHRARGPARINRGFRTLQVLVAAFQSFSHGTNDAQKTMGVITFALVAGGFQTELVIPLWVKIVAACAIGLGTSAGGWRIIRTVGARITHLRPINGFTSDLSSASVILGATLLKLPVSTTHVISSAVMGTGSAQGLRNVKWEVAVRIVLTWIITLPASAAVAALAFMLIHWI